jgi:putative NIF3 family GTP cyclohydrolase 1 type 2
MRRRGWVKVHGVNTCFLNRISRREFFAVAAAGAFATRTGLYSQAPSPAGPVTAQQVVERIQKNLGAEWSTQTVDTFKAGDPATAVRGIVTSAMATLDVLKQAVKAGANFVITCEPTFYSRADSASPASPRGGRSAVSSDPIFTAKSEFIRSNGLVIWRFSDHWRQRRPDPLATGLAEALGWSTLEQASGGTQVTIPAIPLDALASSLQNKLRIRGGIRVVGDPGLMVQKIGLLPGTTPIQSALRLLPGVDAVIAGEVREWETVEYARDKIAAGEKKSLILLGRVVSEDPGMNVCAKWVGTIVPEVKTTWIPAGDPYWRPV